MRSICEVPVDDQLWNIDSLTFRAGVELVVQLPKEVFS